MKHVIVRHQKFALLLCHFFFTFKATLPTCFAVGRVFFHTPAVVQQEAEQAEQDEAHASQYGQQKHSVVRVHVLGKERTCWTDNSTKGDEHNVT